MTAALLAALFVLFLWWFSTGIILYLDGLPARTYRWSVAGATLLMLAGVAIVATTRDMPDVHGACAAFAGALLVWGWNELLFLTGMVTGTRRTACPEAAKGWRRFVYGAQSIIYHELLLVASGLVLALLCAGAANQLAVQTFGLLWLMRLSTKLNIFLGVPNLSIEFLPPHLKYLASFFQLKPMNLLFPVSVTLATMALVFVLAQAFAPAATAGDQVSASILAALLALAILEHWFLVLPLRSGDLWKWGMASHSKTRHEPAPRPEILQVTHIQSAFGNKNRFAKTAVAEPIGR